MPLPEHLRQLPSQLAVGRRVRVLRKHLEGIGWFTIGTVFVFVLGLIFLIVGIVKVSEHHEPDEDTSSSAAAGWVFLSIGLVGVVLGLATLMARCMCPRPPTLTHRPTRHQTRVRGRRASHIPNDRSADQRVWSTPPVSASTPIGNAPSENAWAERRPSVAPPTYDEAIGRSRSNISGETHPPPYVPGDSQNSFMSLA